MRSPPIVAAAAPWPHGLREGKLKKYGMGSFMMEVNSEDILLAPASGRSRAGSKSSQGSKQSSSLLSTQHRDYDSPPPYELNVRDLTVGTTERCRAVRRVVADMTNQVILKHKYIVQVPADAAREQYVSALSNVSLAGREVVVRLRYIERMKRDTRLFRLTPHAKVAYQKQQQLAGGSKQHTGQRLRVVDGSKDGNVLSDFIFRSTATAGHLGILNFANRFQPGGSYVAGGPHTAEEQLWAQSTLFASMGHFQRLLQKGEYLSDSNDVLVTPNVEFFRRS